MRVSILIVLAVAAGAAPGQAWAETPASEIVIRVNGEAVTRTELHRVQADLVALGEFQGRSGNDVPDGEELQGLALRKLIHRRLLLQEAGRRNLSITDDELDAAITELRLRFPDLKTLAAWMEDRGLGDMSLFETVRGDLLVGSVTAAMIDEVQISEEQVAQYYELHTNDLVISEEVRLGIIAVNSFAAGEAILKALNDGVRFRRLAQALSQGKLAADGGITGWVDVLTLPQPLREVVGGLKPGEASQPLRKNADEILIVALADRRSVYATSLDAARPEIERRLLPVEEQRAITAWLEEQKEHSTIEVY